MIVRCEVVNRIPDTRECYDYGSVRVPKQYVEELSCGCRRTVRFHRSYCGSANVVGLRRDLRGDLRRDGQLRIAGFDPVLDLRPVSRYCELHSEVSDSIDDRSAWLTRMRGFQHALRKRARERGLVFP